MPTIIRPAPVRGNPPSVDYHISSIPLDAAIGGAAIAIVLDVDQLRAMAGTSNISATAVSLLRELENEIMRERL